MAEGNTKPNNTAGKVKKKKKKVFSTKMRRTLLILMFIFSGAMAYMIGTLIYINITKGAEYESKVLDQINYENLPVPYKRGDIVDCNGTTLATSKKYYNLILEPKNIIGEDAEKFANRENIEKALKRFFGLSKEEIDAHLYDPDSWYEIVKKGLTYEEMKAFKDFQREEDNKENIGVIGVKFEEYYAREYPYKELACHLIGFTVSGNVGLGGLEGYYDEELNGTNGRTYGYLSDGYDAVSTTEPPTNGYNLVTTIDMEVQKIVQDNVQELQKTLNAGNVSVLVMRPKTCEILALYNDHQYDPNDAYDLEKLRYQYKDLSDAEFQAYIGDKSQSEKHVSDLDKLWRNFVVSDTFEPGSTYKTFVLAGALENGIISPDDTFYCDGHQKVADYDIYCSKHDGHGTQDIATSMANSCNDAFMQIGALMGRSIFGNNQSLFGFGQRTNIDISGEMDNESLSWLVYSGDRLNEVELACSAFGQGVSVTMLQLCTAFCSAINGGYYYQPHVVKRVEDENGNLITNYDKILVRRTVSEQTSAELREMLHGVVLHGTGWRTQMEGYTTGGKTGTAEKLPRNNGKFILSYIGFAPVEDPEVVIYVIVDEPDVPEQDKSSGATVLWSMIAEDLFPYLNIYKTGNEEVAKEGVDEATTPIFVEGSPTDDEQMANRNGNQETIENDNTDETGDGENGAEGNAAEPGGTGDETTPENGGDENVTPDDPGGGDENVTPDDPGGGDTPEDPGGGDTDPGGGDENASPDESP